MNPFELIAKAEAYFHRNKKDLGIIITQLGFATLEFLCIILIFQELPSLKTIACFVGSC